MKKRLLTAAFVASLGGFVFGYDLGALSSASQSLRSAFGLSPSAFGLTISASLWGTVCGSLLAGWFADRVGRRNLIAGCAAVYALAAVAIIKPVSGEWFLVLAARLLCGLAIGGFTVGCPLYLSELAPISHRGALCRPFPGASRCRGSWLPSLLDPSLPEGNQLGKRGDGAWGQELFRPGC